MRHFTQLVYGHLVINTDKFFIRRSIPLVHFLKVSISVSDPVKMFIAVFVETLNLAGFIVVSLHVLLKIFPLDELRREFLAPVN